MLGNLKISKIAFWEIHTPPTPAAAPGPSQAPQPWISRQMPWISQVMQSINRSMPLINWLMQSINAINDECFGHRPCPPDDYWPTLIQLPFMARMSRRIINTSSINWTSNYWDAQQADILGCQQARMCGCRQASEPPSTAKCKPMADNNSSLKNKTHW